MDTIDPNGAKAPPCADRQKSPSDFPPATLPAQVPVPRTDVVESAVELFILGPRRGPNNLAIWAVRARVLQWLTNTQGTEDPWFSRAIRQFSIDRKLPPDPAPQFLLPGTLIARVRIMTARITLNGVSMDYLGPTDSPVDVILLLQADDSDWSTPSVGTLHLDEAVCLAGEIPFDAFTTHPNAPPNQPDWKSIFPFLQKIANSALSSSGLAFDANATLPWNQPSDPPISLARYIVEVRLPRNDADPTSPLLVLLDLERLGDNRYQQARIDYIKSFATLAAVLEPEPDEGSATRNRPRWASLELVDPANLPGFSWRMTSDPGGANPVNTFEFDSGVWRLSLTDQPLRVQNVTPRGVLATNPLLAIPYGLAAGAPLVVNISSPIPPPAPPGPSTLNYSLTHDQNGYHERIDIKQATTVYDPLDAAAILRAIAGLDTPILDAPQPLSDQEILSGLSPTSTQVTGVVEPPVLFGFVPLEEGWAQLPFLNVTDQIMTDILPEPAPAQASQRPILFTGAAVFGSNRTELFDPAEGEPGWSVAVLDAADYSGQWTVKGTVLDSATLTLADPELSLEGLFWLANGAPSAEDALPTLDDWLGAIQSLPLQSPSPTDLYPSPFVVVFNQLSFTEFARNPNPSPGYSSAALATIEFRYAANEGRIDVPQADNSIVTRTVYEQLLEHSNGIFDLGTFWADLPMAWRRHSMSPAIQSLPMTQSQTPPNHPSSSRQLFPFTLALDDKSGVEGIPAPGDWTFKTESGTSWPVLVSQASPAVSGVERDGLALLSLGLPGLAFDPQVAAPLFDHASAADQIMNGQYRHEVALLDEVNAFATLPKDDQPTAAGDAETVPPPGLKRSDYSEFWQHLADLAFSATAEARDALAVDGGDKVVRGLIEPFAWKVSASVASAPYPGSIEFADPNGHKIKLAGAGSDALRGLEGSFRRTATAGRLELVDPSSAEFTVIGESMDAVLKANGRVRDQRGLDRDATQVVAATGRTWVRTRVALDDDPAPDGTPVLLWTAMSPLSLAMKSGPSWDFWVRDLPAVDGGARSVFNRSASHSLERRGENNPAAITRRLNHINGYEWRLGCKGQSPLPLGPLWFYPLSIETAEFDPNQGLTKVSIVGRLHLPFDGSPDPTLQTEPEDRANAVTVTFVNGALDQVTIAPPDPDDDPSTPSPGPPVNDWPLADPSFASDALVFRWTSVVLSSDKSTMTFTGQPVYFRHGVSWTLPPKPVSIPLSGKINDVVYSAAEMGAVVDAAVSIQQATLSLDFSADNTKPTGHHFTASWQFVWGQRGQLQLTALYEELVLIQKPPAGGAPTVSLPMAFVNVSQGQELALSLQEPGGPPPLPPNLDKGAVQIQWSGVDPQGANVKSLLPQIQVLPGFHLDPATDRATRGFAVLTFTLIDQPQMVPVVDQPNAGYMEALFGCRWGDPLQAPLVPVSATPTDPQSQARKRVFNSSAGQVDAAYVLVLDPRAPAPPFHSWNARLLLNGFVEVKNLVSWPRDLVPQAGDNILTLPAARPEGGAKPALNHLRHTARILLNQHVVPSETLVPGDPNSLILLRLKSNEVWTTRAVVEHQLIVVELDSSSPPVITTTGRDSRLTAVQEVRFCAPSTFKGMLDELHGQATTDSKFPLAGAIPTSQSPNILLRQLPGAARGYLSRPLMGLLTAGPNALVNLTDPDTMIVEASVPAFVRSDAIDVGSPTNLTYLPVGTTRAYPAALEDYYATAQTSDDPPGAWVLLDLPFLGRMQANALDGLDGGTSPAVSGAQPADLRVDPVLQLALGRAAGFDPLNPLPLTLANWEDKSPVSVGLAEFDLPRQRGFSRLDAASLRESWFRLSLSLPSNQSTSAGVAGAPRPIDTVLADPSTDEPSVMSRPDVLYQMADPRRLALPPDPTLEPVPPALDSSVIAWHPDSLYMLDVGGSTQLNGQPGMSGQVIAAYGFLGAGAKLVMAGLIPTSTALVRRPAAAVLPSRITMPDGVGAISVTAGGSGYTTAPPVTITSADGNGTGAVAVAIVGAGAVSLINVTNPGTGYTQPPTISIGGPGVGAQATAALGFANVQPVSLAVSPYLGLLFEPSAAALPNDWILGLSELVCFDVKGQTLTSVATRTWYPPKQEPATDQAIRVWAQGAQSRLAADSPIAVIRLREFYANPAPSASLAGASGVTVVYRFLAPDATVAPAAAARRAASLRAQPAAMRYAQGQYGGPIMPPGNLAQFEVAPPQIVGVQPLRLDSRPGSEPPRSVAVSLASGGGLTSGTTYYYKVTAVSPNPSLAGASLESDPSLEVSATPSAGNLSVQLTWAAVTGATGYKVYRGVAAGAEDSVAATISSGATTTFTDTGAAGAASSPPATAWPWGLASNRLSILQADGSTGVSGPPLTLKKANPNDPLQGRLWWQSLAQTVQYYVPEDPLGRKVLPSFFRAPALPGLLPVWPLSPLPKADDVQKALDRQDDAATGSPPPPPPSIFTAWQPVLPGSHTLMLTGARPGAPFAFREYLQTQDFANGSAVVSGSVVAMHRSPRPVLLPQNDRNHPEYALQTWAGWFDPNVTVNAQDSPVDSAFLGFIPTPIGLDLVLSAPDPTVGKSITGGTIPVGPAPRATTQDPLSWDTKLRFTADGHGSPLAPWFPDGTGGTTPASVSLVSARAQNPFTFTLHPLASTTATSGVITFDPDKPNDIAVWLASSAHGDPALVQVTVGVDGTNPQDVKNFRQSLSFPLRIVMDQGVQTLPYEPEFFLFEDPEYNRRLSSTTAQQTVVAVVTQGGNPPVTYSLTLSVDRHEYNTTGAIHYIYFFDPPDLNGNATIKGDIQFRKIGSDGTITDLLPVNDVPVNSLARPDQQDLGVIQNGIGLVPGDTLVLSLTVKFGGLPTPTVELDVPIVAKPVIPVPEAGYALLRKNPDSSVECVRFAFSPAASQIELVDPNDLHRQTVRRRAKFLWRDTLRVKPTGSYTYAIQKITTGGSTHFPTL